MNHNFKNPKTKELFTITKVRTIYKNGETLYYNDRGRQIVDPVDGTVLEPIDKFDGSTPPAIRTPTKNR